MFTGLIEDVGTLRAIRVQSGLTVLEIRSPLIVEGLKLGDSVAINGVCLTAVTIKANIFSVEALGDTLSKTTMRSLKGGAHLNLERALRAEGRLDGHLVQGHVNGTAVVKKWEHSPDRHFLTVEFDQKVWAQLAGAIIPEGSIAIDGTSLTVAAIAGRNVRVSLIPHTLSATNLGRLKMGDRVNIETDMLLRGAAHAAQIAGGNAKKSGLTLESLAGWGYS